MEKVEKFPFHQAIAEGNLEKIKKILAEKKKPGPQRTG